VSSREELVSGDANHQHQDAPQNGGTAVLHGPVAATDGVVYDQQDPADSRGFDANHHRKNVFRIGGIAKG